MKQLTSLQYFFLRELDFSKVQNSSNFYSNQGICTVFDCEKRLFYAGLRLITITLLRPKKASFRFGGYLLFLFLYECAGLAFYFII